VLFFIKGVYDMHYRAAAVDAIVHKKGFGNKPKAFNVI